MSNPITDDSYLDFEELETSESDASTESNDAIEKENFSVADFAILAREANGYSPDNSSNIPDEYVDRVGSQEEEEEEEGLSNHEQKINIKRPYLKIIVGTTITSIVVFCMLFFRYSWFKIMNASIEVESSDKTFSIDPRKQEIDRLKAELALIEQSKKPIEPEPEPESQPLPQPEPEPKSPPQPRPEPEPEPKPKPKPIDPYAQWQLLSQLGTLKSSAENLNAANSQFESVAKNSQMPGYLSTINAENQDKSTNIDNRVASTSLSNVQDLAPRTNNSLESSFPFFRSSQKIVLGGLGVDSSSLKKLNNYYDLSSSSNSKQFAIAKSIKGVLADSIAWTDSSQPEQARGSITLAEPLLFSDGTIALPVGSSIIVEVDDFNRSGFVSLNAIAIVVKNSQGKIIQQEIPEDSLLIRGENNQPLRFKTENSDSDNLRINRFLDDAVRSGTRNLSLPKGIGSTISRTINGSSSSPTNQRKFYFIEPQTPVSIYVNASISLKP